MVEEIVWSTESVERLIEQQNTVGVMPSNNPFFEKDVRLRKANILYEYTNEEMAKISLYSQDIFAFAEEVCSVMTDEGVRRIKLRKYQEDLLWIYFCGAMGIPLYDDFIPRYNIQNQSRQSGKSITAAIFIAWYVIFHTDRNVLILSKNQDKVKDLVSKIHVIFKNMPFYLKPGVEVNNVMTKVFDNGCMIKAETTTIDSGAGSTIHLLYMDEFALVPAHILEVFYRTVFPTVSASKTSMIIITSTPRGMNLFYDLYIAAINGENSYHPYYLPWYMVPGRDEAWKAKEVNNLGSIESFNQEYGCSFFSGSNLVLPTPVLQIMNKYNLQYVHRSLGPLDDANLFYGKQYDSEGNPMGKAILRWHPAIDIDTLGDKDHRYVISIDLASGDGGSYTAFSIFQVKPLSVGGIKNIDVIRDIHDLFKLSQIGLYRSNVTSLEDAAKLLYYLVGYVLGPEKVKLVIELNHRGQEFINYLQLFEGINNKLDTDYLVTRFIRKKRYQPGLYNIEPIKKLGAEKLGAFLYKGRIVVRESVTAHELANLCWSKKGTITSNTKYTDMAMTCLNVAHFLDNIEFIDMVEELMHDMSFSEEWIRLAKGHISKVRENDSTLYPS